MEGEVPAPEVAPEPAPPPPTQLCATHPDREAAYTCSRCGSFVCFDCARDDGMTGRMCLDCAPLHARTRIPWETPAVSPFPDGYLRTMRAVWLDAPSFFSKLPDGLWDRPAWFFAATWFFAHLVGAAAKLAAHTHDAPAAFARATCSSAVAPLVPSVYALLLTWVVVLLGGKGASRTTMRACLYAGVLLLPVWVAPVLGLFLPPLVAGGVSVVANVVAISLALRALSWFVRGRMGLRPLRAWLAVLAPPVVLVVFAVGVGVVVAVVTLLRARHGVPHH